MNYCITMERTQRVAIFFEAENEEDAITKANEIYDKAQPTDFEGGEVEHDYSLCVTDTGQTIVEWR